MLVQSAATESIKLSNNSNDSNSSLVSLLLAVNSRHVVLLNLWLKLAKILATARFGQIGQKWPDAGPDRAKAEIRYIPRGMLDLNKMLQESFFKMKIVLTVLFLTYSEYIVTCRLSNFDTGALLCALVII